MYHCIETRKWIHYTESTDSGNESLITLYNGWDRVSNILRVEYGPGVGTPFYTVSRPRSGILYTERRRKTQDRSLL